MIMMVISMIMMVISMIMMISIVLKIIMSFYVTVNTHDLSSYDPPS